MGRVLTSTLVATVTTASQPVPSITIADDTHISEHISEASVSVISADSQKREFRVQLPTHERWDSKDTQRFKELARLEAFGEITVQQMAELEALTRLRRRTKYPRSADEILWERRQGILTHSLIAALQAYVKFHETTDNS